MAHTAYHTVCTLQKKLPFYALRVKAILRCLISIARVTETQLPSSTTGRKYWMLSMTTNRCEDRAEADDAIDANS